MPNPSGSVRAALRLRRARAKSESPSLWRRAAAVLTTLALAGGLSIVAAAAPASAHTGDLKANAVCNPETGQYDVTYTLQLTEVDSKLTGSTKWRVGSTSFAGTPTSDQNMDRGPIASKGNAVLTLGTESLPGTTTTAPWVYAYTKWSDGFGKGSDGRIEGLKGDCGKDSDKITFCHATGSASNPYERITTSVNAFFNAGHDDHQNKGDIYPAFSYVKQGKTINVAAQGDQSLLQYSDCVKPFDWNWQYAAPTCEALKVVYPSNIPSGQANDVNVRIIADGKELTLNFHKGSGTWSGTQTFTFATHKDWPKPKSWTVTWVQVAGTNFHWTGEITCGEKTIQVCHWDAKKSAYEKLSLAVSTFRDGHDSHDKDIHPSYTYTTYPWWDIFHTSPQTKTAPAQGDQSLLTYEDCVKPATKVTVAVPTFSDTCGVGNYALSYDKALEGVVWNEVVANGKVSLTATVKPGYVFSDGTSTKSFGPYTLDESPCVESIPIPAAPTFSDSCGVDNYVLDYDTTLVGVVWNKVVSGGTVSLTATAESGYVFSDGTSTVSFGPYTLDQSECVKTITLDVKPTFSDSCGIGNYVLDYDKALAGVIWSLAVADGKLTLNAKPDTGYAFAGAAQSIDFGPYTLDDSACVTTITLDVTPTFSDTCGVGNYALSYDKSLVGVLWSEVVDGGVVRLNAKPDTGFAFSGDLQSIDFGPYTLDESECVDSIPLPAEPKFSDECGLDNYVLEYDETLEGVTWSKVVSGGEVSLTATADNGYVFSDESTSKSFGPYTLDESDCVTTITLDVTPTFTDECGVGGYVLSYDKELTGVVWTEAVAAGAVTLNAKPAEGYAFAGESQSVDFGPYTLDESDCAAPPVDPEGPTLDGSVAVGECQADVPWILYTVQLNDTDDSVPANAEVFLVITDGTNTETRSLGTLDDADHLSDKVLWPGASVDADGNPTGWPGWEQEADGTWVETTGNFAWTRGDIDAKIEVNPELAVDLSYPPATPDCANGPTVVTDGGGDGETTTTAGGSGLASTGFAGTSIAIVAGLIVLAGAAFLVVARARRKKA
ncbi:LPXTG cell wall anchor domain-containing protein [Agromyces sp. Marseille-Q5079]|uniref:LPXTG cell wall anchor domain-containing protein n=1 Tax=Agromyces sp. Marseille-Q5079 TaxID=3439059 RepID=UPI003D9C821F